MVENILQGLFSMFDVRIDYDASVSDLSQTALKLNVPFEYDMLASTAERDISEQCQKQLKNIAAHCFNNERLVMTEQIGLNA
ncbi:hypothetical protein FQZ97_906800 [compost metagenome]